VRPLNRPAKIIAGILATLVCLRVVVLGVQIVLSYAK
jgi:hypothetical protein